MRTAVKTWCWIATSIFFEVGGDVACKKASLSASALAWGLSLLAYNLMLLAWLMAIRNSKAITVAGTVWLLAGQVALVVVGHCMGESLTAKNLASASRASPETRSTLC